MGFAPLAAAVSLLLALLLASIFHRGRAALTALVLLWLGFCLGGAMALGVPALPAQLTEVALVLTPWTLLLILLLAETPLLSLRGLLVVALLGLKTALGLSLPAEVWGGIWSLERWPAMVLPEALRDVSEFPLPGVSAWVGMLGVVAAAARFALWRDALDLGLALALLVSAVLPLGWFLGAAPWMPLTLAGIGLLASTGYASYRMAFLDALTGLPGRRMLDEYLARLGRRYAVAMVDVDHFKQFNDRHGHEVGDQVLKLVATMLRRHFGRHAYRYGGEEFTVVFAGGAAERAEERCEGFRAALAVRKLVLRTGERTEGATGPKARKSRTKAGRGKGVGVTASIGIAARDADYRTPEAVLKRADEALYAAKQAGRNRVVLAGHKPAARRAG